MIWVVDKKVVHHLVTHGDLLAEVPLRISFEYALDAQRVVEGTLSIKVLYNRPEVCRRFPTLDGERLEADVQKTAREAVSEHLKLSGFELGTGDEAPPEAAAS